MSMCKAWNFLKNKSVPVCTGTHIVAVAWSLVELGVWAYLSISQGHMLEIPTSAQVALGIAVGGGVTQNLQRKLSH